MLHRFSTLSQRLVLRDLSSTKVHETTILLHDAQADPSLSRKGKAGHIPFFEVLGFEEDIIIYLCPFYDPDLTRTVQAWALEEREWRPSVSFPFFLRVHGAK